MLRLVAVYTSKQCTSYFSRDDIREAVLFFVNVFTCETFKAESVGGHARRHHARTKLAHRIDTRAPLSWMRWSPYRTPSWRRACNRKRTRTGNEACARSSIGSGSTRARSADARGRAGGHTPAVAVTRRSRHAKHTPLALLPMRPVRGPPRNVGHERGPPGLAWKRPARLRLGMASPGRWTTGSTEVLLWSVCNLTLQVPVVIAWMVGIPIVSRAFAGVLAGCDTLSPWVSTTLSAYLVALCVVCLAEFTAHVGVLVKAIAMHYDASIFEHVRPTFLSMAATALTAVRLVLTVAGTLFAALVVRHCGDAIGLRVLIAIVVACGWVAIAVNGICAMVLFQHRTQSRMSGGECVARLLEAMTIARRRHHRGMEGAGSMHAVPRVLDRRPATRHVGRPRAAPRPVRSDCGYDHVARSRASRR